MTKIKIRLPQNPYNELGLTGQEFSVAFYKALMGVMSLNPDAEFIVPEKSATEESWAKNHNGDMSGYDWEYLHRHVGRPW